jgi:hypothetical protein
VSVEIGLLLENLVEEVVGLYVDWGDGATIPYSLNIE